MKIAVVLFSSLLTVTSASFFSELANSISSVQSGIGKLLSDATVDLKYTIDCSVYAMRQAFSDEGIVQGYQKCQENNTNIDLLYPSNPGNAYITPPVTSTPTDHSRMTKPTPDAIDMKNNGQIEKKNIDSYLSGFVKMNFKLEHEFEDLSKHVNEDLINIENVQKQVPMENVVNKIDRLFEKENSTENEIHEVYDKILTKLDKDNTDEFDLKDEIESVITELEQNENQSKLEREFQTWKEKEMESLNDIKNMLKKSVKIGIDTIKQDGTLTNISNTTETIKKETVTEHLKTPETSTKTVPAPRSTTAIPVRTTTPVVSTTTHLVYTTTHVERTTTRVRRATKTTQPSYTKPDHNVTRDKPAIDLALQLVSESRKTASIMANILKRRKSASSVFDHPELLTGMGNKK